MHTNEEAVIWFRYTLALASTIVVVWLVIMSLRYWRRFDTGQKLWAMGAIGVLIYVADGLREAAALGLEFRLRLIPLVLGLIAYFAYLLESRSRKVTRFGRHPFKRQ